MEFYRPHVAFAAPQQPLQRERFCARIDFSSAAGVFSLI
jgi:hypothetical protein